MAIIDCLTEVRNKLASILKEENSDSNKENATFDEAKSVFEGMFLVVNSVRRITASRNVVLVIDDK